MQKAEGTQFKRKKDLSGSFYFLEPRKISFRKDYLGEEGVLGTVVTILQLFEVANVILIYLLRV